MRRRVFVALLVFSLTFVAVLVSRRRHATTTARPRDPRPYAPSSLDAPAPRVASGARVLLVGGGAEPESGGVQLEQDVRLASETLAGPSVLLFGGGATALSVREDGRRPSGDALRATLAEIFDPRDRAATYRATRLSPDGPATARTFLQTFESMLSSRGEPAVVFAAAHGEQGFAPNDTTLVLWSGHGVMPRDVLEILLKPTVVRGSRLVVTSCHGGAFADIAVGDDELDPASPDHCGLFATTWDHVASGCDTNPDRSAQEGYAIHFFAALRGVDRAGNAVTRADLDLDGDGAVGLLDAHTYVRVHARSFDVPTTTSERFLRAHAPSEDVVPVLDPPLSDPYEDAVVGALGPELDANDALAAEDLRARRASALASAESRLRDAEDDRDDALADVRIELLERFPRIDDPWDPELTTTLDAHREEIDEIIRRSTHYREYQERARVAATLGDEVDRLRIELARVERLTAAFETKALASFLRAAHPDDFARWQALRRCERYAPPLR